MASIAEDTLTAGLADWLANNRGTAIPEAVHIYVANRDEIRFRPCIVVAAPESKEVSIPPNTSTIKLEVHLFTAIDDTPVADHNSLAKAIADVLSDKSGIKTALNNESFVLHGFLLRETSTAPDEARGRESVLTYEAFVSAV